MTHSSVTIYRVLLQEDPKTKMCSVHPMSPIDLIKTEFLYVTGNGGTWPCGAAGTSSQPKISSNEVELVWKILPLGKFASLLRIPILCYNFCSTTYG